jgi:hypothetical protein
MAKAIPENRRTNNKRRKHFFTIQTSLFSVISVEQIQTNQMYHMDKAYFCQLQSDAV